MNANPKVDAFLKAKKHPLTKEIQKVREIILSTSDKIVEDIKWSTPTFMYKRNIASYFFNAKKFVNLMFHKGALIKDKSGLLEGDAKEGRVARFTDMKDIEAKRKALQSISELFFSVQSGNPLTDHERAVTVRLGQIDGRQH